MIVGGLIALLLGLAVQSMVMRREVITATSAFAALWIVGLLAFLVQPLGNLSPEFHFVVAAAALLLFLGEQLVPPPTPSSQAPRAFGSRRGAASYWYWALTAAGLLGALLKLTESLTFAGDLESMVASTALRGAVTSAELTFSPVVTALTSCMYLAAAVSGFLCSQRPRPRCFAHFVPAVLDSLAIAGRGSFLIVCLITILGFGLAWRGDMRKAAQKLGGAAVGVCIVVFGLSLGVGRGDVLENGWEYVVAPIFGLDEYLRLRPPPGIDGMTLVNALSAKLGGQTYDAGDFVWYAAFKGNVSSGFKEVASDFGMAGLMLFPLLGAAAAHFHQRFRQLEEWSSYALALSCCSLLGYFYYVSLSSFLPAWWALVGTGVASAGLELLGRIVRMQRPAPPAG